MTAFLLSYSIIGTLFSIVLIISYKYDRKSWDAKWSNGEKFTTYDKFSFTAMFTVLWPIGLTIIAVNAWKDKK